MNFDFIPGLHSPAGFWISLGAMLSVVASLIAFFRWRRWL
jgi:Mg2+ and Co2+ transporter CorA